MDNGKLQVPNDPIIPFIEGDGIGPDIWKASVRVFDAAVEKAYQGERKINWLEVYAGEKAFNKFNNWLPNDTIEKCKEYLVSIKRPAYYSYWRRNEIFECSPETITRFICLPKACSMVSRGAFTG